MLQVRQTNYEDIKEEYKIFKTFPKEENGYVNLYSDVTEETIKDVIEELINRSKGIGLKENQVPETYFFLYDDDIAVGLFKVRHELNKFYAAGPGHISYGISKEYRNKGYATKGLALVLEEAKKLIKDDDALMCAWKINPNSLKVQLNNGAVIYNESLYEYFTKISLRK